MESVATFLLLALVAATLSSAIPKHDDNKRVIDKVGHVYLCTYFTMVLNDLV